MCAFSSSRITELLPTVGSSTRAPSPGWIASGEAMNSSRISSGSDRITNGGWNGSLTVNRLP